MTRNEIYTDLTSALQLVDCLSKRGDEAVVNSNLQNRYNKGSISSKNSQLKKIYKHQPVHDEGQAQCAF